MRSLQIRKYQSQSRNKLADHGSLYMSNSTYQQKSTSGTIALSRRITLLTWNKRSCIFSTHCFILTRYYWL